MKTDTPKSRILIELKPVHNHELHEAAPAIRETLRLLCQENNLEIVTLEVWPPRIEKAPAKP